METNEVNLNCLRAAEKISIHTANSVYEFSVIDPASRAGILKGGSLGEAEIVASLFCYAPDESLSERLVKLNVGAKAMFICVSVKGARRLITSRVRRISYTRENQSENN